MQSLRPVQLLSIFLGALAVRLVAVPTWSRLVFEGHETQYLEAFQGQAIRGSTRAYPLLTGLYSLLGQITSDPRSLIVLSGITGALAAVGVALWIAKWIDPRSGLWAGVLVALLPEHAAWSTSAYNVILPHALLIWAFVLGGWRSVVLVALATSMRFEVAILALFLGFPGALGGLAAFAWGIDAPQVTDAVLAFDINWPMVGYLGPPILALGLLGLRNPKSRKLLVLVLWVHGVGMAFDDYGARHALLGSVALCGLVGASASWSRGVVPMVVAVGLAVGLWDLSDRWHRPGDVDLIATASSLDAPDPACVEVTEEPPVTGQALPSHVYFFRGDIDAECVVWGEEFWHRQWASRGLADRAMRMRTLYRLTPVGALRPVHGGPVRLYHRLERRW